MPLPTLLLPGKIIIQDYYTKGQIDYINSNPAKDFILEWFKKRVLKNGFSIIKIKSINDRVLVIKSGTGSGKSTTFAPELYINFFTETKRNIAITQPTTLTAVGIPESISEIYRKDGLILGENIGWQTGSSVFKPNKGIVFLTTGTLVQQLIIMDTESFCKKYSFIIIDECHSRSLEMDLCLYLLKQFLIINWSRKDCPFLILTSATIDPYKYSSYFGLRKTNVHIVEGSSNFPIKENFLTVPVDNYLDKIYNQIVDIHKNNTDDYKTDFRDILVFLYGSKHIRDLKKRLDELNVTLEGNHFIIVQLTSDTFKSSSIDFFNFTKKYNTISIENVPNFRPKRRIILTTNVAETGITPENGKYVIDSIFSNKMYYFPQENCKALVPSPIVRANIIQRRGRVGRREPGEWFPMTTRDIYDSMRDNDYPDIILNDFSEGLLRLIIYHFCPEFNGKINNIKMNEIPFNYDSIQLLDPPSYDSYSKAIEKLFILGLIDQNLHPTVFGLTAIQIRKISLESRIMILHSFNNNCPLSYIVTIVCCLNSFKFIPLRFDVDSFEILKKIKKIIKIDNFLLNLFLMELVLRNNISESFCEKYKINKKEVLKILESRDELLLSIRSAGLRLNQTKISLLDLFEIDLDLFLITIRKIKVCAYEGYKLNLVVRNKNNKYENNFGFKVKSDLKFNTGICSEFQLIKGNGMYVNTAINICILDSYVKIDRKFHK